MVMVSSLFCRGIPFFIYFLLVTKCVTDVPTKTTAVYRNLHSLDQENRQAAKEKFMLRLTVANLRTIHFAWSWKLYSVYGSSIARCIQDPPLVTWSRPPLPTDFVAFQLPQRTFIPIADYPLDGFDQRSSRQRPTWRPDGPTITMEYGDPVVESVRRQLSTTPSRLQFYHQIA